MDPATGAILGAGTNYDTWASNQRKNDLVNDLAAIPNGRLISLAVADEAGLNVGTGCTLSNDPAVVALLNALEALGSTKIRDYCWRSSWAFAAIKGIAPAISESVDPAEEVRATAVPEPRKSWLLLSGFALIILLRTR